MKLEIWKSNMSNEEHHYFIPNKGKGCDSDKYVFGYNPQLISKKTAKKILDMMEFKMQET